ncbi:GerAB/ArcD/ProY family transporter [Oceanirhabdus sp. W0125-5]|uniref:GerAB/ArcD/ProY family transporter n=1 Tax=Oceanirhabdus sp. W0125-5 TaxID=2999116 RepID=UPI0022F2C31B|nr:endospore germination permease [Oceanirhabdus sp. W0125-5]WBW96547.1 endospore germination permease [Oceanirhabdus sp. W0125-5]
MEEERLSDKQGISLIVLFIMGSSLVLTTGGGAGRDLWIAIILSILIAMPIVLVHARLLVLFPGKDLFDILEILFGKNFGKGISLLFLWFSFFLGVLVLRVFGDFISVISLLNTPKIFIMFVIGMLCIWGVKEGIKTLGKWAELFVIVAIASVIVISVLLIPKMNINNFRPVLYDGVKPIIKGTFHSLIFPFTQTIIFTTFFSSLKNKSLIKVYLLGLLIGGTVLFISSITDILVLGSTAAERMYFPSHATAILVEIGALTSNLEILFTGAFLVGGFIKVSMCLLGACNGFAKLFGCDDYNFLVMPIGLLIVSFSHYVHDSIMDKVDFALHIYPPYAFPFQVVLPIIIWIFAERKKKQLTKQINTEEK